MHCERLGPSDAPAVVLLHGGGMAGWMWRPVAQRLATSHHVLVPDLPGHGRSADAPYTTHDDALALLRDLLGALPVDGPRATARRGAVVVGFSLGAQLAVALASTSPELVRGVMAVSAQAEPMPGPLAASTLGLLALASPLARYAWFARAQARELHVPDELLPEYLATSRGISRTTLVNAVRENLRFEPPAGWRRYPGPAVVMAGARERALMLRSAAALRRALPGCVQETVPDAGHGLPLQRPGWLAGRIEELSVSAS
ncbi:alpha/beta fold hydrolase [Zafaria sp. J156]|uniref:alpha/beta fold hydrolase n=1 Tax=Zafaria sp. J156 TaxID=3116490 RepID=UPI002E7A3D9F|nr:alpha/beta hydrolase [Zafaria sp. J156]MEE1620529.1 alpha/beta hydrolase [Zafaria sp. J156]